jgi:hypothetical protein
MNKAPSGIKKSVSYFHATYLFDIAVRASKARSGRHGQPAVCIVFCATALEAFINECGRLARVVPTSERQAVVDAFATVMKELEEGRESLAVKYHLGLLVFKGTTWDEGKQPFQDFKLLIALRNELTHMKGDEWTTPIEVGRRDPDRTANQYPKFVRALYDRGVIAKPTKSTSWLEQISTPDVSVWACRVATEMAAEFFASVPDGYFKDKLSEHLLVLPAKRSHQRKRGAE